MPKMTVDDEAYLEAFEQTTTVAGWDCSKWASLLGPLLIGQSQVAIRALSCTETNDYKAVKQAILYRLEILPELYRHQFRAPKRLEEKRPWILAQILKDSIKC